MAGTEAGEARRAKELARQGHLLRLWKLPGKGRALGLWRARDLAEMQAILKSLPLDAWMTGGDHATYPTPQRPRPGGVMTGKVAIITGGTQGIGAGLVAGYRAGLVGGGQRPHGQAHRRPGRARRRG